MLPPGANPPAGEARRQTRQKEEGAGPADPRGDRSGRVQGPDAAEDERPVVMSSDERQGLPRGVRNVDGDVRGGRPGSRQTRWLRMKK